MFWFCLYMAWSFNCSGTTFEDISRFSNGLNCYCYLGDLVCVKLLWHLSGNNGQIFLYLLAYCKLESTDLNGADVHVM
jgi:hypothetical protein